METTVQVRFARTPRQICLAMGVEPTPAAQRDIAEYLTWPDFPPKSKEGYDIDGIFSFVERNKQRIASRKATALLLQPDSKTKFTGADLKLIQSGAVTPQPTGKEPPPVGIVDTQAALANMLSRHYGNRISIHITPNLISEWRRGTCLKNAPLPPPKIDGSSRFDAREWVTWFDQHLLHYYLIGKGDKADDFDFAKLERETKNNELERIEHERFERAVARGKYVDRDVAFATLAGALKKFHNLVKSQDERGDPIRRKTRLRELGVSAEICSQFHVFDLQMGRELTEFREKECARLAQPDKSQDDEG